MDTKPTIPRGFVFNPTDEDAMLFYVQPRNEGVERPNGILIPQADIYGRHPQCLPSNFEYDTRKRLYFFINRKRKVAKRVKRSIPGVGTWKTQGRESKIPYGNGLIGHKKKFYFQEETETNEKSNTGWVMEEYSRCSTSWNSLKDSRAGNQKPTDDEFVLCKIKPPKSHNLAQDTVSKETSSSMGVEEETAAYPNNLQVTWNWEKELEDLMKENQPQYPSVHQSNMIIAAVNNEGTFPSMAVEQGITRDAPCASQQDLTTLNIAPHDENEFVAIPNINAVASQGEEEHFYGNSMVLDCRQPYSSQPWEEEYDWVETFSFSDPPHYP